MNASRSLSTAALGVPTGAWRWASLGFVLLALGAAALTIAVPQVAGLAGDQQGDVPRDALQTHRLHGPTAVATISLIEVRAPEPNSRPGLVTRLSGHEKPAIPR